MKLLYYILILLTKGRALSEQIISRETLARRLSRSLQTNTAQCSDSSEFPVLIEIMTDGSASLLTWVIEDLTHDYSGPFTQISTNGYMHNHQMYSDTICLPRKHSSEDIDGEKNFHIFFYYNRSPSYQMNNYDSATKKTPFIRVTVEGFLKYYEEEPVFLSIDEIHGTNNQVIKIDVNDIYCQADEYLVSFVFKDDVYGDETKWSIIRYNGDIAMDNTEELLTSATYSGQLGRDATYGVQYCIHNDDEAKVFLKFADEFRDGWDCGQDYYNTHDGDCDTFLRIEVDGKLKLRQKDPGHLGPDGEEQIALNMIETNDSCIDQTNWKYDGVKDGISFTFDCALVSRIKDISPFSYDICAQLDGVYFKDKTVYTACCACGGSIHMSVPPSAGPSTSPSTEPSPTPSSVPSEHPSTQPSANPSAQPSSMPSAAPSAAPSSNPSSKPSLLPSSVPSTAPSSNPSSMPSAAPSSSPSSKPSLQPSSVPSAAPSSSPSSKPSTQPSSMPSAAPSSSPSSNPSTQPSSMPSAAPSASPSVQPTRSSEPSDPPTQQPTPDFSSWCQDSTERFEVTSAEFVQGRKLCAWAYRFRWRCNYKEVRENCPDYCDNCACLNSPYYFYVPGKGQRNCEWATKDTWWRCTTFPQVSSNCPLTCGFCHDREIFVRPDENKKN